MSALPLQPVAVDRPWGGRRIARRFGWDADRDVGEWWLASAIEPALTPLRDRPGTLADWLDAEGARIGVRDAHAFPLLVKFLDAKRRLSLQVHPDDEVARRHGHPRGKTEAWYVLDAAPGARVYVGAADGVDPADVIARVEAGDSDDDEILGMLRAVPAEPGTTVLVEAGTIHAVGGGVALFEVQQSSDVTFRIHDWNREGPPRALHLDEARDAARTASTEPATHTAVEGSLTTLIDVPAFRLALGAVRGRLEISPARRHGVLTATAGIGKLGTAETSFGLAAGDAFLVHGPCTVEGDDLELLWVEPGP